jgi:hypothetical protein
MIPHSIDLSDARTRNRVPAITVFEDRSDVGWLKVLERGFRHCFVLLAYGDGWTVVDAVKTCIAISHLSAVPVELLLRHYSSAGRRAVLGVAEPHRAPPFPSLRPLTCVEIVKRVLGTPAPGVWTPRQLHRHLTQTCGFVEHRLDTRLTSR